MANIVIVGDGAIGLLYSHFLSTGNQLTIVTRRGCRQNKYYYQQNQQQHRITAKVLTTQQLPELAHQPIDMVIFAVKAYQVSDAFKQLKPYFSAQCSIVLSHNGLSNLAPLQRQLQSQQALFFLTTRLAGFKITPTTVTHTGNGESVLGSCNAVAAARYQDVMQQLQGLPNISFSEHITLLRWQKLLVNIAINPLTALHNVKNGALTAPQFSGKIVNVLNEACHVANLLGVNVQLADALANAYQVMSDTKDNYSSMHQDIAHNRMTEIDAMCGYICQQGQHLGISTPHNQSLVDAIRHKKSAI
ncbi:MULTISPECIES: ketopantoate reductase family protein [Pseudoalteromonas]|uniref:ketopantoate reductase family protein n=1 Tax=Pseudoalteromonas TaxID=53246 RepID=UPI0002DD2DB1|nr:MULTISPECIES: 2-dehydropantoate 2-reductase [Pseudoalteromonas]MCF6145032.1 2-dehydropantoate 2-reductase [Pseudoalteromonas mariniglutinosa NCIMB 1770]